MVEAIKIIAIKDQWLVQQIKTIVKIKTCLKKPIDIKKKEQEKTNKT